jgi:anhydro-N-acetylmuramic acid kinase
VRILSLQSGTSVDGIDVAIVDIDILQDAAGPAGASGSGSGSGSGSAASAAAPRPTLSLRPVLARTVDWSPELHARLVDAVHGAALTSGEFCQLDTLAGQEFAAAAASAIRDLPAQADGTSAASPAVDLVVSHGQTLFHWVEDGSARGTLQIGEPSWIVEATGSPVLANLRAADIAAGGEGAPLMGLFDQAWLGAGAAASGLPAATVNLGGIANVQIIDPNQDVIAFDSGPGNGLLDAVISRATDGAQGYDADGALAAAGQLHPGLLAELLAHPYFAVAAPKSTGRETFTLGVVDAAQAAAGCPDLSLADLACTLTALTARTVADAVVTATIARQGAATTGAAPERLIVSGGGTHNPTLLGALATELAAQGIAVESSEHHGIDPNFKESYLFALIGFLSWHGVPCRLPATPPGGERLLGQLACGSLRPAFPAPLAGIAGLTIATPDSAAPDSATADAAAAAHDDASDRSDA